MRVVRYVALRWLAALAGVVLGWAAAASLLFAATGASNDAILSSIFIGIFCLTAWILVGLPLAVIDPAFPTRGSPVLALLLSGMTGAGMVAIAFRPTSAGIGLAFFLFEAFLAGAVAMLVYTPQSRFIAGPPETGLTLKRFSPALLAAGLAAGIIAFPLGSFIFRSLESQRTVTAMMTWAPVAENAASGLDGVLLRFAGAASHYMVEHVPGLLEHLRASGKTAVPVQFVSYFDYRGKFKGYSVIRIDGVPYRADPRGFSYGGETAPRAFGAQRQRHPLDVHN